MVSMRRYRNLLFGLVAVLAILNVWRWVPWGSGYTSARGGSDRSLSFQAGDFESPAFGLEMETAIHRDLFRPKLKVIKPAPAKVVEKPPEPPPKTPEQLEEEAARAELAQIKFVGVVFREQKGQAFLVRGDQAYLAFVGDKVGTRFIVEKLSPETVYLKDPKTNVGGQLSISGR